MSVAGRELFLCSCNGTQPLDAAAIGRALDLPAAPKVRIYAGSPREVVHGHRDLPRGDFRRVTPRRQSDHRRNGFGAPHVGGKVKTAHALPMPQ